MSASATAVADVAAGTVHAAVEIAAPPDRIFRALTDPRELPEWWGSPDTYRTFDWSVDLKPGGQWSCSARTPDQELSTVRGEYRAIDPPRLLEFTWLASWEQFLPSVVRIEIEPTRTGARVTIVHRGGGQSDESYHGLADGWKRVLGWLSDRVASPEKEVAR
jgi:uncharacterized protein YndB with AHSA1/START domain